MKYKSEETNLNSTQMLSDIHNQVGSMHKALFNLNGKNPVKTDEDRIKEMKAKLIMTATTQKRNK